MSLPKKIISMENKDKKFHEKWGVTRDLMDIPHPFRLIIGGPPNSGKSTIILNIILRVADSKRPFEEVLLIHCDADNTEEYEDLDCEYLDEIPAPSDFEGKVKTLVILEDLELEHMNRDQRKNLDRLFGYVSTHKHVSVIATSQDPFRVPSGVRRCCNFFIFFKTRDMDSLARLARKTGLKGEDFKHLFDNICNEEHDSLWIDITKNSPAFLRKNCYEEIDYE